MQFKNSTQFVAAFCSSSGGPLTVDVYVDEANKRSYQVDSDGLWYRVADFSRGGPAAYGEWMKLDRD